MSKFEKSQKIPYYKHSRQTHTQGKTRCGRLNALHMVYFFEPALKDSLFSLPESEVPCSRSFSFILCGKNLLSLKYSSDLLLSSLLWCVVFLFCFHSFHCHRLLVSGVLLMLFPMCAFLLCTDEIGLHRLLRLFFCQ